MEAGRSRMDYEIWRALFLPDLKFKATVSRVLGGWPLQRLDEKEVERKLAQQWLDEKAQESGVETSEPRTSQDDPSAASLGPLMTTSEAQALIQEEIEGGRPVTLKAFENALRRAAKTARESPEELPLQLGGQHKDWQLVKLGPESGGHGKGHWLRRRQPHTTASGDTAL